MKSFFTKLGTLLLCGVAVAMVGCTDFSEDIQAGDKVLGDKIEQLQSTTASTIAELRASITALEAAQKKMEADYAKKSDLDAAKTELQDALNAKVATLNNAIAAINTTLDGKADKTTVAALQSAMEEAVAEANEVIQNLLAAQSALEAEIAKKADQTELDEVSGDVEILKGGYQETTLALTNLQSALEGTQLDLAATESSLKQTQADVNSLIQGYMETVAALQQFQADLASKASQTDLELAQKDIKALKTASAEAVYAIANLNTAVETLDARVEAVEEFMNSAKNEIQNHTNQLLELSFALEQAKGDLEDEAEIRAKADEALQQAYATLTAELTNFEMAYAVDKAELEAQINLLKEEAKKNTEGITNLNGKFEAAIAELEAQLDNLKAKHAEDYASILNLIASNRTEMEQVILDLEEELRAAFEAADVEVTEYVDEQVLYVLTTVYTSFNQHELWLNTLQENVDTLQEDLINALNIIATNRTELEQVISDLEVKLDAKIDDVYAQSLNLIATNRSELEQIILDLENNLKGLIGDLQDRFDVIEGKVADLEEQTAELEDAVEALQDAHAAMIEGLQNKLTTIDNTIEALQDADADNAKAIKALQDAHSVLTEQLQNKLTVLDNTIETLTEAIADNKNAIEENGASIEANAALIAKNAEDIAAANKLVAEFQAEYQVFVNNVNYALTNLNSATETNRNDIEGLLDNVAELQTELAEAQDGLLAAIGRIEVLEDAVKALQDAHAAIIEGLQNKFTSVDNTISSLQDADDALTAALKKAVKELYDNDGAIAEDLARNINKVMGLVNQLADRVSKIEVDVQGLKNTLNDLQAALDAAKKELGDKDAVMSNTLDGLKQLCKEQQDLIGANIDNIYKNAQDIAELYLQVAALVERMNDADDFSKQLNNTIQQLSNQMWEMFGLVDTQLGLITEAYTAADAEIRAELEAGLAEVLALAFKNDSGVMDNVRQFELKVMSIVDALRADVDKLLNRIQSVVYVPTHSDAKARVEYAVVGTLKPQIVQSSKNTIEYQVYPESAAKEIADAYNNGDENFAISFLSKDVVPTRSATEYITVVAVNGDPETGILTVNYRTNFDVKFFPVGILNNVTKSYSAALVIENTANDEKFSTEYTNFVAGECVHYNLGLKYTDGSSYRGKIEEYEIEYTDKKVYPVLDQIVPVFYNSRESLTASQFEEAYGAAPEVDVDMNAVPSQTKTFVTTFDETVPSVTVQLGENVNLNNVGEKLYVTLTYSAGGDKVVAIANVEVVGVKVNYAVENELTATWEYLKDASSDVSGNTHRTFEVAVADITVDNVLANTSLKDILASFDPRNTIKITSNDVEIEDETIALSANAEKMTVEFDNFKWDATYNVVATYNLKYARVKVEFTIVTVDREREAIEIELGTTTLNYVKDLEVAPNTYKYDLAPVVAKLVELGNLDANYADDIFCNHLVEVNNYCKFDAEDLNNALTSTATPTSNDIMFDFQNKQYTFRYNSNKLEAVHSALVFNATFTTWYGQVVTIKHNLAFTFPVYDFVHTTYYVKNDNGNYYSQVMGVYEDGTAEKPVNTTKLQSFTTDYVNLNKAFSVVDAKGAIVENLAALGLVTEFEIEGTHGAGIEINNNIISYNDKDAYVDVIGRIYLQNANGTRVELPTSFATTYAGYTVKKYDPIGELKAYDFEQKIENKIKYNIPVLKHFTLKDSRNFVEMYDLIDADGNWVDGNNNNGFAEGETPCTVYGLSTDYGQVVIPAGFEDIISFKDGILTFDNTNNMAIVEDIVIDITFVINYTWGDRQATVKCTFPKNI